MANDLTDTEARPFVEMQSVEIYNATMDPQTQAKLNILNAFENCFAETSTSAAGSSDGLNKPQFLDIACGPGNFTFNTLLPRYMGQCRRIVAIGKDSGMIRFASLHHEHEKIDYHILDVVEGDMESFVVKHGLFARVFCFSLLHWLKDRAHAMKNIEKLMAPGGECLIFFKHCIPVFEVFMAVARSERWKKYAKLLEYMLPATAWTTDFREMRQNLQSLLVETDLKPLACEVLRLPSVQSPNIRDATARIVSCNPIYPLVDNVEKEELFMFTEKFLSDRAKAVRDGRIPNQQFAYVIHAYKPATHPQSAPEKRAFMGGE